MNWIGCGRNQSLFDKKYYCGILLEGLRKMLKNCNQDKHLPSQDLNLSSPEYKIKSEVLLLQQTGSA
jgi:hypothetical protein